MPPCVRLGYSSPTQRRFSSKWVYAKSILAGEPLDAVRRIAGDLNMNAAAIVSGVSLPLKHWEGTKKDRLFISHVSADKDRAMRLRTSLRRIALPHLLPTRTFFPTKEWEWSCCALHTMDAFLAMHTKGFSASNGRSRNSALPFAHPLLRSHRVALPLQKCWWTLAGSNR